MPPTRQRRPVAAQRLYPSRLRSVLVELHHETAHIIVKPCSRCRTKPARSEASHLPVDQPGYLRRFRVYYQVCAAEICVGKVEWCRGVDPGSVQWPDDIVNFEHPFDWPSVELAYNLGPSALIPVSKCLEECAFSSEWPTE